MTRLLLSALREGFEGPSPKVTFFLDSGPDSGLRNTLAGLSAAEASRPIGGNSVAAHAHHILFSFDAFAAYISGDRASRDWNESWRVSEVDEASWAKLQDDLVRGYESLRQTIKTHADASDESLGGSVAALAHLAYHLGAIRQKLTAAPRST